MQNGEEKEKIGLEDGALLMKLLDTHCPSVMLNTSEGEEVSEASSKVAVIHCVDYRIQHLDNVSHEDLHLPNLSNRARERTR